MNSPLHTQSTHDIVVEQLQTVYDPEFPLVDIYTMGLIYDIVVQEETKIITITMTFTSPTCPVKEMLEEMVRFAIRDRLPSYTLELAIVWEPVRSYHMMKDDDLKRMFE